MLTSIELDQELVSAAMRAFGTDVEQDAVREALETAIRIRRQAAIRDLRGIGWDGDEEEVRGNRWRQDFE